MYLQSQNTQQQAVQHQPSIQSTQYQPNSIKLTRKDSKRDSHTKFQHEGVSLKIHPVIGDSNTVNHSNHPNPDNQFFNLEDKKIQLDKNKQPQFSSKLSCFRKRPDPSLEWEHHQEQQLYSEFSEFIESRFKEVLITSSINKHYAKIGFQIFIFIFNFLELIFTLSYKTYNIDLEIYEFCYTISIISSVITHILSWMYSFNLRQVVKKNIFVNMPYYIFYMVMGGLSFLKIAPFIYYFNRDQSINQYSFSEINKYLILNGEDKFRNPLRLLKKRAKPVNIFRDFIFHRLSVLSMIITLCLQTFPQIFIQGFYNSEKSKWDGFNTVSFILLIINLIYYLFELYFIIITTTSRFMQTELEFKMKKIKLKYFEETKQLLKADQQKIGFIKSFYFHIDSSKLSSYQKKVCMVLILTFLTRYKRIEYIQFHYIDCYEEVTLYYLANCLKLIQVQRISLLYYDQKNLESLKSIFQKQNFPNLTLQFQENSIIDAEWDADQIDINDEEEKVQDLLLIENPKISSGWQAVQQNYFIKNDYIKITEYFMKLIPKEYQTSRRYSKGSFGVDNHQNQEAIKSIIYESPEQIVEEAQAKIDCLTKRAIFEEYIGKYKFLLTLYDYYQSLAELNECHASIQSFYSMLNGSLQIVSLYYLSTNSDNFTTALIVLTLVHPFIQLLLFAIFQSRVFKNLTPLYQIEYVLLYGIFNFFKIWDIIMIVLYLAVKQFSDFVRREFNGEAYIKFKNYASKFEGSLPISIFSQKSVQVNPRSVMQIKYQPFYQAVIWATDVQEVLNKLPQCFIYILVLQKDKSSFFVNPAVIPAIIQQVKESLISLKELLKVLIQDFFIPALILSRVSEEQFLQSILYFNSISNQMELEYPKSFSILSKANERFIKESCILKINLKTLDFTDYKDLQREKILAQVRLVLASIENKLEIDDAQRFFLMGSEVNDFIRCLIASRIYQLKLNFSLDEVDPHHTHYLNAIIKHCPSQLQLLQIQIEASELKNMEFLVERQHSLKAFSYSFFQKIKQEKSFNPVLRQKKNSKFILEIKEEFLHLDRYNFEQFYFEVSGNLGLSQCNELLAKFTEMKVFKLSLYNKADIQIFEFSKNLTTRLDILDITFENIRLDFQQFRFNTLKKLKMVLKMCEFEKEKLETILLSLNFKNTKEVDIDVSQSMQIFTTMEQKEIVRNLERKNIDVIFKI
ncbi:unnamed protein product [Paramecium primaurelia]|uniref:Transmembrane protein n=1 Tax=Paramecium primaurelia TaxID=5886 RepID=A0A8S1Q005_PARPR|nr:unnamed protein product [Paramecium primaurelia]